MKKKILASILAVATMATCVFSAVACNKEVPKDEVLSSVVEEVKEEGEFVVEDVTSTPGMSLKPVRLNAAYTEGNGGSGVMPMSETTGIVQRLTATVKDEEGKTPEIYQSVTWSMAWASTNSAEINDYVKMTTNGCVADIECLQGFNTQIIVTCTSTIDPTIKATATLDYYKRFETVTMSVGGVTHTVANGGVVQAELIKPSEIGTTSSCLGYTFHWCESVNFSSVGTVNNSFTGGSITVEYTDEFKQKLQNNFGYTWTFTPLSAGGSPSSITNESVNLWKFLSEGPASAGTIPTNYGVALFDLYNNSTNEVKVTLSIGATHGGTVNMTYYLDLSAPLPKIASVGFTEGTQFIL